MTVSRLAGQAGWHGAQVRSRIPGAIYPVRNRPTSVSSFAVQSICATKVIVLLVYGGESARGLGNQNCSLRRALAASSPKPGGISLRFTEGCRDRLIRLRLANQPGTTLRGEAEAGGRARKELTLRGAISQRRAGSGLPAAPLRSAAQAGDPACNAVDSVPSRGGIYGGMHKALERTN